METATTITRDRSASKTVADLCIEDLAAENLELRARVASLESDVSVYRDLVSLLLAAVQHWRDDPTSQRRRERLDLDWLRSVVRGALLADVDQATTKAA